MALSPPDLLEESANGSVLAVPKGRQVPRSGRGAGVKGPRVHRWAAVHFPVIGDFDDDRATAPPTFSYLRGARSDSSGPRTP